MSVLERVTVPVIVPAFSLIVLGFAVTLSVSTSVTFSDLLPLIYPDSEAVMVTVCVPSSNASSTAVIGKLACD